MAHKKLSTKLSAEGHNLLSTWDEAIAMAKSKIKEIKRSIRTFESLRNQGAEFPVAEVARKGKRRKTA
jgi:hypothetical protein